VIDEAAAANAKKAAEAHAAAAARAAEQDAALGARVPMHTEIEAGQEQLAKRLRPRRGYCLDVANGGWYEGNVSEEVGVGTFKMNHDNYAAVEHVPAHQIVADGDILFVTYDEVEDVDPERIFRCEVSIRDVRQKDVIFIINPEPEWERDDAGELEEFIVNLNARTPQQREGQPSAWAHSRTALEEKCAALAAHAQPDPALGTPQWTTKF